MNAWRTSLATFPGRSLARSVGIALMATLLTTAAGAQVLPHDDNLPHAKPRALQQLSDDRLRQRILQDSQAPFQGACACPKQATDARGRACHGHVAVLASHKRALCSLSEVTDEMLASWRKRHR